MSIFLNNCIWLLAFKRMNLFDQSGCNGKKGYGSYVSVSRGSSRSQTGAHMKHGSQMSAVISDALVRAAGQILILAAAFTSGYPQCTCSQGFPESMHVLSIIKRNCNIMRCLKSVFITHMSCLCKAWSEME